MKKISFRIAAAAVSAVMFLSASVAALHVGAAAETVSGIGITGDVLDAKTAAPATTSPDKADYYSKIADMNEDLVLNSADARIILRLAAKVDWVRTPRWLSKGLVFGDIDNNGKLNSADARWTLRVAAKLNTVPEVIAAEKAKPTTTKAPTTAPSDPSATPQTTVTTTAPATTNPNEVKTPFCDPYSVKMKTSNGVSYTVASDGLSCYISSDDLLKGFSVKVDRNGDIFILSDADKEYTSFGVAFAGKIGVKISAVRDFAKKLAIPEFDVFEGCTVTKETYRDIPFTVAQRDGYKFYFYADGSLDRIVGKDLNGKTADFEVEDMSYDADDMLRIPTAYSSVNSNVFLLKNGISLLRNKL